MCKRICDKCKNFEVSMDNMKETCHAMRDGSQVIPRMPIDYVSDRIEGNKSNCKSYEKI